MIWLGVRVLAMVAFALSSALASPDIGSPAMESPMSMAASPVATLVSIVVTLLVAELDSRRIGAPLLLANLGYSWRWSAITTGALAIVLETLLHAVLRLAGTPT